uniref:MPN domain-containing protein n=1 Tax=Rhabditophanes sp. KR3021 TaxID=114890 RepID=A0AC35TPF2_9BILA
MKTWELENQIDAASYHFDEEAQKAFIENKPWEKDQKYFEKVKISSVALLKMAVHANSGGDIEIMGVLQGTFVENTFIITDVVPLPVEGTETRVNAQDQAYEYMVSFTEKCPEVSRKEKIVGWYHSHPGYGCWLSGIDVETQRINQQFTDPYLAIVIDPHKTAVAGKVEIGAFRVFTSDGSYEDGDELKCDNLTLDKAKDFGAHAKEYYSLEVSYYKSPADDRYFEQLWQTNWYDVISKSTLRSNRIYSDEINKLASSKLRTACCGISSKSHKVLALIGTKSGNLADDIRNGIFSEKITQLLFDKLSYHDFRKYLQNDTLANCHKSQI